jgi:hypothetical protein
MTNLSLDIGAGTSPKGDINADIRPLQGINVVCHALKLPVRDCVISKTFLSHVIEHFTYKDVKLLLNEVNRVMIPGGTVEIWIPNFQSVAVLGTWIRGRILHRNGLPMVAPMLSGDQDFAENVHMSVWTLDLLDFYLKQCGFELFRKRGESRVPLLAKYLPSRCVVLNLRARKAPLEREIQRWSIKKTRPVSDWACVASASR